jgi:TRAP-type mannitol/chloroaromatic compound transport system substrate-binding protein
VIGYYFRAKKGKGVRDNRILKILSLFFDKKGGTIMKKVFFITVLIGIIILINPYAFAQEVIKWKAQTHVGIGLIEYQTFENFCKKVKVMTNGRLEITPYPATAICPTFEILTALKNNVIQASMCANIYWAGKDPAFAALGDLVCAWNHPMDAHTFFNQAGGLEMLREVYKPFNVHCVGTIFYGIESMPSQKPVRRVEDFKGLKWRCTQGMAAEWLKRCGASVVIIPGSEIYSALEKGVVDGADWGTVSTNFRSNLHQVAKYFNYPGFHSMPTLDFSVNQAQWNKLPEDIKQILTTAVWELSYDMAEKEAVEDTKAIKAMKDLGCIPIAWKEEDIFKARKMAMEVWDDWAKKSPMTKRVIEKAKEFLRQMGKIK